MSLDFQVLSLNEIDEVYAFAEQTLAASVDDSTERAFQSWSARWRREALSHYLRLGWSFIAREQGRMVGFFLAQPFLFFRGQTQTLWIEHLEARDSSVCEALLEVAVKVAREKHLQRVLLEATAVKDSALLAKYRPEPLEQTILEIKTTKG